MWNILSVGGDVSVDSEASVVTSSISRPNPPAQTLGGAHKGRVCMCAFIGVGAYTYCECLRLYCVSPKKKKTEIIAVSNDTNIYYYKYVHICKNCKCRSA